MGRQVAGQVVEAVSAVPEEPRVPPRARSLPGTQAAIENVRFGRAPERGPPWERLKQLGSWGRQPWALRSRGDCEAVLERTRRGRRPVQGGAGVSGWAGEHRGTRRGFMAAECGSSLCLFTGSPGAWD